MSKNNARKSFSLKRKYEVIVDMEMGRSKIDIHKSLSIASSTLSLWWKNKEDIKLKYLSRPKNSKKLRGSSHADIEKKLLEWFNLIRSKNIPVSGNLLIEKANELAKELKIESFSCIKVG